MVMKIFHGSAVIYTKGHADPAECTILITNKTRYLVGNLSTKSINRILSRSLIRLAPADLAYSSILIGNQPLDSPDYDGN